MYSIDAGLAEIRESMYGYDGAPEPHDIVSEGMMAIRESLYGSFNAVDNGNYMAIEEACENIAEWMTSNSDPFIESALSDIRGILGVSEMGKEDLKQTLLEAVQAYQEGLINFKIDSIESVKKAIDIIDLTPATCGWIVGVVLVLYTLYAICVIGVAGVAVNALTSSVTSIAASLGLTLLVSAVMLGALYIGMDLISWATTKAYNKITGSNEISPMEKARAIDKITKGLYDLEQKFKKEKKLDKVRAIHRLYDDIGRRWGLYQQETNNAAAHGAMIGGMIGAYAAS